MKSISRSTRNHNDLVFLWLKKGFIIMQIRYFVQDEEDNELVKCSHLASVLVLIN